MKKLMLWSLLLLVLSPVVWGESPCESTSYLEAGRDLIISNENPTLALQEIVRGNSFLIGETELRYEGADSITEENPQIKFNVFDSGQSHLTAVTVQNNRVTFELRFSGYGYVFHSTSDPTRQDYTIQLDHAIDYSTGGIINNIFTPSVRRISLAYVIFDNQVDQSQIQFYIDGRFTPRMYEGDSYTLADSTVLSLDRILFQDYSGGIQAVWFCMDGEAPAVVPQPAERRIIEPVTGEIDLRNYPSLFMREGIFNAYVTIGERASSTDNLAATDLIYGISTNPSAIPFNTMQLDSEVSDPEDINLVVVSTGCVNVHAVELLGSSCNSILSPGEALIQLFEHDGHAQLLVMGYEGSDTRRAARVLQHYADYALSGRAVIVRGTMENPIVEPYLPAEDTDEQDETDEETGEDFDEDSSDEEAEDQSSSDQGNIPTTEVETTPTGIQCTGCRINGNCLPYGTRLVQDGQAQYCSIEGTFQPQQEFNAACQNNYECVSNQCSNGQCVDLQRLNEQLEETNSLLARILAWLERLFS